ncbi:MAG TPA: FKBP-type peptidyl-prolyl cis-trans isomerase [Phenylobacterium sp.]|jgi:peptidylprolyl isomerase/FKBP-type peptidyl-prolyl cis-trans isomerase FklB|nr:FKBP-type peptidyl-prolyl cis-trans isomerase [Phenylobacterium sp.]
MGRALVLVACVLALAACHPKPSAQAQASAAEAFLAQNAKKPGVHVLPDGLQFQVVQSGPANGLRPALGDEVKVNYEGKLTDGKVFDSSYERGQPAAMPLKGLIPAWQEALPLMRPGDVWMLYVPPKLGYGEKGAGDTIPPNAALTFKIELIDFLPGPGRIQQG